MHPVLRSAGWLWPSLTELWPDIRAFRKLLSGKAEQKPRGTDSASHTVIYQASMPLSTPITHTYTHRDTAAPAALTRRGRRGLIELYGSGQSASILRPFYQPLT